MYSLLSSVVVVARGGARGLARSSIKFAKLFNFALTPSSSFSSI